jgi:CRP-like cAMP-binding protein
MPMLSQLNPEPAVVPTAVDRNEVLAALPADSFARLDPYLTDVTLAKASILHEPGQAIDYVYFVREGMVSLMAVMPDGDSVETATIGREGAVGLAVAIGWRTPLSRAVVQMPVAAARIAASRLIGVAEESAAVRRVIAACCQSLFFQIQQVAACSALHGVQARLCRWFLQAEHRCGSMLPITQEGLSQLLGVQRTTINMLCRSLQSEGLIRLGRGLVEVRDAAALEARACGCYRTMVAADERMVREL